MMIFEEFEGKTNEIREKLYLLFLEESVFKVSELYQTRFDNSENYENFNKVDEANNFYNRMRDLKWYLQYWSLGRFEECLLFIAEGKV